jgi:D-sedoheptulose 7-phosphate isomerase
MPEVLPSQVSIGGTTLTAASLIQKRLAESADVKIATAHSCAGAIENAAEIVSVTLRNGGKVLLCGNGGSASDCQHIAAELVGRFRTDRRGLPALALTADTSVLTSVGNDLGFEKVFSRQVEASGRAGDVLIGVSTSARSKNVIEAMILAREIGLSTIAFVGLRDGPVVRQADVVIKVPSSETPRIQEAHITIGHIICELIENSLSRGGSGRDSRPEPIEETTSLRGAC